MGQYHDRSKSHRNRFEYVLWSPHWVRGIWRCSPRCTANITEPIHIGKPSANVDSVRRWFYIFPSHTQFYIWARYIRGDVFRQTGTVFRRHTRLSYVELISIDLFVGLNLVYCLLETLGSVIENRLSTHRLLYLKINSAGWVSISPSESWRKIEQRT